MTRSLIVVMSGLVESVASSMVVVADVVVGMWSGGGGDAAAPVVGMVTTGAVLAEASALGGDFGDGGAGGALVDDAFAVGEGGDQCLDGEVVDCSGDAAAGLVHEAEGVVAEPGVRAAGELEVVLDVGHGLSQVHAVEVEPQPDALVEGGQGADLQPAPEGGLAQQQAGEWGVGVHVVVGEHTDLLELLAGQQVGLIDDEHA